MNRQNASGLSSVSCIQAFVWLQAADADFVAVDQRMIRGFICNSSVGQAHLTIPMFQVWGGEVEIVRSYLGLTNDFILMIR